jgi:hypothetical protein
MRHKKRFTVSDTVTYRRTWYVWAYTEDEALETAENEGPDTDDAAADYTEEQIDNTPYEALEERRDDYDDEAH